MNVHAPIPDLNYVPHSIELEQQLLGAVLMSNDAWFACSDLVEPEHFFEPLHSRLWSILSDHIGKGGAITPVGLAAVLGADANIDLLGMSVKQYIARLAVEAAAPRHAPDQAKAVRNLWSRRRLISLTRDIQASAMGVGGVDVDSLLEDADRELGAIRFGKNVSGVSLVGDLAEKSLEQTADAFRLDGRAGFNTGILPIDEMLGPLMPGDMVTILAPSGHAKTALGAQILRHNAEPSLDANRNAPGVLISMEMDGVAIARRVMASYSGISARAQKAGEINEGQYSALRDASARAAKMPLYIDGSGRQKTSTVIKKLRAMKRAYGITMAVVDHVKLLRPENPKMNKFETIEHGAMELKDAAKELGIVLFLLAQVTRESQKRDGWRVRPGDLWGGEVVRECSDFMLTCCLPAKWLQENPAEMEKDKGKWAADIEAWTGYAEIGAPKVRDGDGGSHRKVAFNGVQMLFSDK